MKKPNLILNIAIFLAIIISYFYWDLPLAEYFHNNPLFLVPHFKRLNAYAAPELLVVLGPVVFFFVYYLFKKKKWGERILYMAVSMNTTSALVAIVKFIAGRYRPEKFFSEGLYGFHLFSHNHSFPSAHAAVVGALFLTLGQLFPKQFPLYALLALFIAFTRVVVEKHYFSDILAGLFIAQIVASFVFQEMNKRSSFLPRRS